MSKVKQFQYSPEVESILKRISFNKSDYSYSKMLGDITFRKHSLTHMQVLRGKEAQRCGEYYYSGVNVIKYFDVALNLYVITTEPMGNSTLYVSYYKDKDCTCRHREDGPAKITLEHRQKAIFGYSWFRDNMAHRDGDLPQEIRCITRYNQQDNIGCYIPQIITYRKNDRIHRDGNPASITFFHSPRNQLTKVFLRSLSWYQNGKQHNDNGVSSFTFSSNYNNNFINLSSQLYQRDGKLHRFDGPAWLEKTLEGKINYKRWYVNGKRLDRRKYPYMENGVLKGNMLKHKGLILKTTLFDREYGQFIRGIIDGPKKP